MFSKVLVTLAVFFTAVQAHGIVYTVEGGAEKYQSPLINSGANPGPFYLVNTNAPVHGADNPDSACGAIQTKASKQASVKAGSTLSFTWNPGYSNNQNAGWPHNTGPVFMYMAKVGKGEEPSASTKWTKIVEYGMDESGKWKQALLKDNKPIDFPVPKDIQDGDYIIRVEPINLAISEPEYFPSCSRWTVTGGGSADIATGDQVTFPGGYKDSDPGLSVSGSGVYQIHSASDYQMPGPKVFGGGSGSGDKTSSSTSPKDDKKTSEAPQKTTASSDSTPKQTQSSAPQSTSSPSTGSSAGKDCSAEFTACSNKYDGGAQAQQSYDCQTAFKTCQESQAAKSKRMLKRSQVDKF